MADAHATPERLESREPSVEDLVELCSHLNELGARYLVVGGFAAAVGETVEHDVSGVRIPFASPELLLRMKGPSLREKDRADAYFLDRKSVV